MPILSCSRPHCQKILASQRNPMSSHQCPTHEPFTYFAACANITTHLSSFTSEWILDLGASHHITANLGNLPLHYPYLGHDDVLISNGNKLFISHIGSLTLNASSNLLTLDNVLCVPSTKIT